MLAGGLVAASAPPSSSQELLGALSAGERVLAFAHDEPGSPLDEPTAGGRDGDRADGDAWTLTGVKEPVPHGARADVLVVSAALPDGGTGLFVVAGGRRRAHAGYPTYDGGAGRPGRLRRHRRPRRSGEPGADLTAASRRCSDIARIDGRQPGARCDAVRCCDATTEYLKQPQAVRRHAQHASRR